LLRIAQELRSGFPSGAATGAAVFHSRCVRFLYKPVDNTSASFADNHLARNVDFLRTRDVPSAVLEAMVDGRQQAPGQAGREHKTRRGGLPACSPGFLAPPRLRSGFLSGSQCTYTDRSVTEAGD
jgi:hypothetical protein